MRSYFVLIHVNRMTLARIGWENCEVDARNKITARGHRPCRRPTAILLLLAIPIVAREFHGTLSPLLELADPPRYRSSPEGPCQLPGLYGEGGRRRDGASASPGPASPGRVRPEAITSRLPDVVGCMSRGPRLERRRGKEERTSRGTKSPCGAPDGRHTLANARRPSCAPLPPKRGGRSELFENLGPRGRGMLACNSFSPRGRRWPLTSSQGSDKGDSAKAKESPQPLLRYENVRKASRPQPRALKLGESSPHPILGQARGPPLRRGEGRRFAAPAQLLLPCGRRWPDVESGVG